MKKLTLFLFVLMVAVFQFCSSSKKIQAPPKMTYATNLQPTIAGNCSPCHVGQAKSGHLDTYLDAKKRIDDMITRIQKNPTEKGFMPFKHAKLPDSTIQVFVKWRNDGLLEN